MNLLHHISYVDKHRDGDIYSYYGTPRIIEKCIPVPAGGGGDQSCNKSVLIEINRAPVYASYMRNVCIYGDTFEYARYPVRVQTEDEMGEEDGEEDEKEKGGDVYIKNRHTLSIDGWVQRPLSIGVITNLLLRFVRVRVCVCVADSSESALSLGAHVIRVSASISENKRGVPPKYVLFTSTVTDVCHVVFTIASILNNRAAVNPSSVREHWFVVPITGAALRACDENVLSFVGERIMCGTMHLYGAGVSEIVSIADAWKNRAGCCPNRIIYI